PASDPVPPSAIEQARDVIEAGEREDPVRVGGELDGIAHQHQPRVVRDAERPQPLRHLLGRWEVTVGLVPGQRLPPREPGSGDVPVTEVGRARLRLRGDLEHDDLGIVQVIDEPVRADEWLHTSAFSSPRLLTSFYHESEWAPRVPVSAEATAPVIRHRHRVFTPPYSTLRTVPRGFQRGL